jgi:hypothetical protein
MAEDPASVRRLADLIRERSDTVHWEDVKHDESNQTSESKVCRILRRHCATTYSHATYVPALS